MPTGLRRPVAKVVCADPSDANCCGGAGGILHLNVAARSDRDMEPVTVRCEGQVAGPVSAAIAQRARPVTVQPVPPPSYHTVGQAADAGFLPT